MSQLTPYIFDVTTATFDQAVIQNSFEKPVLVDFWAEWCAPCKALMPMLAKVAESYQGELLLAKVDCEAEQDIVARFGIQSLPTVVLELALGQDLALEQAPVLVLGPVRVLDPVRDPALEQALDLVPDLVDQLPGVFERRAGHRVPGEPVRIESDDGRRTQDQDGEDHRDDGSDAPNGPTHGFPPCIPSGICRRRAGTAR